MLSDQCQILTVGHSDHTIERFVKILRDNFVSAIADVRSMPYSKFTPQFNREQLASSLKAIGVRYVFLGDLLGARRLEPECYVDDQARYDRIAQTPRFQEGLRRLRDGSQSHRIALLCAEKDPLTCHRAILVCRHLRPMGMEINHIVDDGSVETNQQMEQRLLNVLGLDEPELFCSRSDTIERAYDIQGDRIAYTRDAATADERGTP